MLSMRKSDSMQNMNIGLKQSGLLDQMACAVGGVIAIDFKEEMPKVEKVEFGYDKLGYDLIIVNTGKGHADLSEEYSAVPV